MDEDFASVGAARVDPQVLRNLMRKSDLAGFIQLGSHLLALFASGLALWMLWGSWWGVPVFVVHGALINWLYAAQHESSHDTVFRTRWLNEALGRFTGFVLVYPRDYDRWQHFCHHRHTQDPERDAELLGRAREGRLWHALSLLGFTLWYYLVLRLVWHAVAGRRWPGGEEAYLTPEQERKVVAEARWHLAGYGALVVLSLALQTWAVVVLWWAPMLATTWSHQIQNYIEHGGMPHVADTWQNTRTMKTIAPVRWLSWGMVYHTAHHTYPGVPFHRLADLHREICAVRGKEPVTVAYLPYWWAQIRTIVAPARA